MKISKNYLIANVQQNDIIVTMGAGKITALATYLLGGERLKKT